MSKARQLAQKPSQPTGRKNLIINGAMQVAQRGTSFSASGTIYTLDRWEVFTGNSNCITTQEEFTVGQTDVPHNSTHYINIAKNGETEASQIRQKVEDVRILSGETVTLSFWANTSSTLELDVFQNFGSGGSAQVQDLDGGAFTVVETNNSWSKYVITHTLGSVAGKTINDGSYILFRIVEQASTTNDVAATQVQLEVGSTATEFEHRSYGEELALCQRYYYQISGNTDDDTGLCAGFVSGTTKVYGYLTLPVSMRAANQSVTVSGGQILANGGTAYNFSLDVAFDENINVVGLIVDKTSGGNLVDGEAALLRLDNLATGKLTVNSEL